jgi:polyadenylate-binding protein
LETKLLVDGFPSSFTEQDLKNLFAPFGSVISVSIIRDPKGESLRMGHVEMAFPQEARKAKQKLHMSYVQGKMLLVFVEGKEKGS